MKRFEISSDKPESATQTRAPAVGVEETIDDYRGGGRSIPEKKSLPYPAFHLPHSMPMNDIEHLECLLNEIPKATEHILISSWGVNEANLRSYGVHDLLKQAKRRGIRVYIYIGGYVDERTKSYVLSIATKSSFLPIHTKIFAVDRDFAAVGSFNWLSPFGNGPIENSKNENGTFVYKGCVSNNIKDEVWEKIKLFMALYHGNARTVKKLSSRRSFFRSVHVGNSGEVLLLATSESHINYLSQQIQNVKHKVILTSYSVTDNIDSKIPDDLIMCAITRGVKFYFITNGEENCEKIRRHFSYFNIDNFLTHFTFLNHPFLHSKTWVFDDETIVQTSYNLFSAAPRVRHKLFDDWSWNCESGLAVTGDAAKPFIQKYYRASLLGIVLQSGILGDLGEESLSDRNAAPQVSVASSISPTHLFKKRKHGGSADSIHCNEDNNDTSYKKAKLC